MEASEIQNKDTNVVSSNTKGKQYMKPGELTHFTDHGIRGPGHEEKWMDASTIPEEVLHTTEKAGQTPSNAQQRTPDKCVEAVTVGWRGETGQQVFDRLENTPPGVGSGGTRLPATLGGSGFAAASVPCCGDEVDEVTLSDDDKYEQQIPTRRRLSRGGL